MKRIGILGGLSAESTIMYYRYITRMYYERFQNYRLPEIVIYSVSLEKYIDWRNEGRWDKIVDDLVSAARAMERAGADFGVIATNTMHKVFDEVQTVITIPFISLIDSTIRVIKQQNCPAVGLLGTKFTMNDHFWRDPLQKAGVEVHIPDPEDQEFVHRVIEDELSWGLLKENSRNEFKRIIDGLTERGARGVILGCTEIPMLVQENDCDTPLFDTSKIHAIAALDHALDND